MRNEMQFILGFSTWRRSEVSLKGSTQATFKNKHTLQRLPFTIQTQTKIHFEKLQFRIVRHKSYTDLTIYMSSQLYQTCMLYRVAAHPSDENGYGPIMNSNQPIKGATWYFLHNSQMFKFSIHFGVPGALKEIFW